MLVDELAAFARLRISPRTIYKRSGILVLEADWPVEGLSAPIRLQIGYSPLHPFFRPAVSAPDETFERHQNPLSRDLCLLTQETGQWDSNELVADFIQKRLNQLLQVLAARKEGRWNDAAELEEQVADPLMPYYAGFSEEDSVVLFDGQMGLPNGGHGMLEVAYTYRQKGSNAGIFEAVLRQVKTSAGAMLGKRFELPNEPKDAQVIAGRWVRFTPPLISDAGELLRLAEEELSRQAVLQPDSVQRVNETANAPFSITAIAFPEEAEYGAAKEGVGWLFLATRDALVNGKRATPTTLVLGERAGRDDVFARLPVARSLVAKKALVVGCGAIGSFAGLELARAGVGSITFFDHDVVQPGNSLRWPLGRSVWGRSKARALADFVSANYPWTRASSIRGRLGAAISDPTCLPGDLGNILTPTFDALREADIVIDASASPEVQHALAYFSRKFGVPYVMGYATYGVAGGVVARFLPGSKSCFVCLHQHWNDKQHIPRPRVDDTGVIIPVGCNAPTFTGGGFDLQEVSLEMVRTAVGVLSEGSYDPGKWQLAMLTLKGEGGERILPHWEGYDCPPHPSCCGTKK